MRIPLTINSNIFKVYEPSKAALGLSSESKRTVKSEDRTWDEHIPPPLSDLCLLVIVANFEKNTIFEELPCWEKNHLLEILPTNLPLSLVTKHIDDEIYWERMVKDRWKEDANYCQDYGMSWKRMYLERHLQEAVEAMTPEGRTRSRCRKPQCEFKITYIYNMESLLGFDFESVEELTRLTKKYVKNLNLRELQIMQPFIRMEDEGEFVKLPEPSDHIDLCPIITKLPNLTELHVQFGLRNVGSDYKSSWFNFSRGDCRNLGIGVGNCDNLRVLRIHNCNLDSKRVLVLLANMELNTSLEELNFSNCLIGDSGATGIAKFMRDKPNLKRLNLCNNRVKRDGVAAIAFTLVQKHASPLEYLNLKFNPFGDEGLSRLTSALIRENSRIRVLNIACCGLGESSGILLAETLNRNLVLTNVDMSNNHLGEKAGRALENAMRTNRTIEFLDLRMTEISDEDLATINLALHFNRIRNLRGESGVEREYKLMEKRAEEEQRRLKQEAEEALAAELAAKEEAEKQQKNVPRIRPRTSDD